MNNDIQLQPTDDNVTFDVEPSTPIESSDGYGVSSSHPLAVKVGMDILEKGGNAVDAAVAVSYALGVVEPYGSGIGGGGEMLILPPAGKKPIFYEYREKVPISGTIPSGYVGIPGFVKGLEVIHNDLGSVKMADLIQPSIDLAENGFKVNRHLTERLEGASSRMPIKSLPHLFPNGEAIKPNEVLKQTDLAETLKILKKDGTNSFYDGMLAQKLLQAVQSFTPSDLESYSIEKSKPVYGKFKDFEVISAPAPLAGATLIQSLQMTEILNLASLEVNSADYIHLLGEISKRAYFDRLKNIADPSFFQPPKNLTSKEYTKKLVKDISLNKLSENYRINDSVADEEDYDNTTHFVVVDKKGMVVSTTNTLGNFFGSGKYVGGFFLNNQLSNFSNSANLPNSPAPGKRPRSFTSPTILKNKDMVIGIGTPGGKRIPMVLTQVIIRHLLLGESIQEAIDAPRFYVEDKVIYTEEPFSKNISKELRSRGYKVIIKKSPSFYGGVQALIIDRKKEEIYGGADERRSGYWQVAK
ncbi:gamma-glutamyltransferase [Bacillus sp. FJAT-49870]|uniref:Glutathione hydrolase proenzyme n=2 Tax=Lederbergia citri TaxID=2833580 RepID=A0A942TFX1_9BACI|nr:gamma-glutamyltransferase [Lederbergia citri]